MSAIAAGGLHDAILGMKNAQDSAKIIKVTAFLLRCFLFFDLSYLITSVTMVVVGLTNDYYDKEKMVIFGLVFGSLAFFSAVCNSLASYGVRTWRRAFLVPWLIYYMVIISLLTLMLAHTIYYDNLHLSHILLFLLIFFMFSAWKHIQRQFFIMSQPKPEETVMTIETVWRTFLESNTAPNSRCSHVPNKDAPPKYEDLDEQPPRYDEIEAGIQSSSERTPMDTERVRD